MKSAGVLIALIWLAVLANAAEKASYEQRLRNAKSVKVMTQILGVGLGSSLAEAHAKLDKESEGGAPARNQLLKKGAPGSRQVLWKLVETDYSAVLAKTNAEGRVTSITGFLREDKAVPFEEIGDVTKAPLRSANGAAWDVIRPGRPLFRVVAEGAEGKARSISIFEPKRDTPTQ